MDPEAGLDQRLHRGLRGDAVREKRGVIEHPRRVVAVALLGERGELTQAAHDREAVRIGIQHVEVVRPLRIVLRVVLELVRGELGPEEREQIGPRLLRLRHVEREDDAAGVEHPAHVDGLEPVARDVDDGAHEVIDGRRFGRVEQAFFGGRAQAGPHEDAHRVALLRPRHRPVDDDQRGQIVDLRPITLEILLPRGCLGHGQLHSAASGRGRRFHLMRVTGRPSSSARTSRFERAPYGFAARKGSPSTSPNGSRSA